MGTWLYRLFEVEEIQFIEILLYKIMPHTAILFFLFRIVVTAVLFFLFRTVVDYGIMKKV